MNPKPDKQKQYTFKHDIVNLNNLKHQKKSQKHNEGKKILQRNGSETDI